MKAYIYGYGNKAKEYIDNTGFIEWVCGKYSAELKGIIDKDKLKCGTLVEVNSCLLKVYDDVKDKNVLIFISLNKFEEIKKELISEGFDSNLIVILYKEFENYQKELIGADICIGKNGLEIGGPSELYKDVYALCNSCDCVNFSNENIWTHYESEHYIYNEKDMGIIIIAEATNLKMISNDHYDFLLSSNNLEHIANPLKALNEFVRVLKSGGYAIIAVPKKDTIFDHNRVYTSFEHIMEDYKNDVGEDDLTHLEEIIAKHDYDMDPGCGGKENFIKRAKRNVENRCLHHHVFSLDVLEKMFFEVGLRTITKGFYGTNYFIIGKKII